MQQPLVWLVEDETSIADTLTYMLQQEGFAVKAFERGLPVLEEARRQVPALAILDVGLPDISGFELLPSAAGAASLAACAVSDGAQ